MCERRLRWRRHICGKDISVFKCTRLDGRHLLNSQGGFGNHLTGVGAKDVDTEDAVGLGIRKEFDLYQS